MMTKAELQDYLSIRSTSKLLSLIEQAGLNKDSSTFTDEQVAILEGFASTKQSPSQSTNSGASLAMPSVNSSLPQVGQRVQQGLSNAAQRGRLRAQQDMVVEAAAYAETYSQLYDQFDATLQQVHDQAYVDVEAVLSQLPSGNDGDFFAALLPQANG